MLNLFRNLFSPYEVKLTKNYIKEFFKSDEVNNNSLLLSKHILNEIESQVLERVSNKNAVIHAVRIDKIHPENIALVQILNALDAHIGSGNYHLYRGLLRDDGRELHRILNLANSIGIEKGYFSKEDVDKANSNLEEQIANAG